MLPRRSGANLLPLEEYLRSDYQPDREYVDGEIHERNLGEKDHSKLPARRLRFYEYGRPNRSLSMEPVAGSQVTSFRRSGWMRNGP